MNPKQQANVSRSSFSFQKIDESLSHTPSLLAHMTLSQHRRWIVRERATNAVDSQTSESTDHGKRKALRRDALATTESRTKSYHAG